MHWNQYNTTDIKSCAESGVNTRQAVKPDSQGDMNTPMTCWCHENRPDIVWCRHQVERRRCLATAAMWHQSMDSSVYNAVESHRHQPSSVTLTSSEHNCFVHASSRPLHHPQFHEMMCFFHVFQPSTAKGHQCYLRRRRSRVCRMQSLKHMSFPTLFQPQHWNWLSTFHVSNCHCQNALHFAAPVALVDFC